MSYGKNPSPKSADLLKRGLRAISDQVPLEYRVEIAASTHFRDRLLQRAENHFSILLDVLSVVVYNYPLILYFSKLDHALPERGRLVSDKYVICGDIIADRFVLRTFYEIEQ